MVFVFVFFHSPHRKKYHKRKRSWRSNILRIKNIFALKIGSIFQHRLYFSFLVSKSDATSQDILPSLKTEQ